MDRSKDLHQESFNSEWRRRPVCAHVRYYSPNFPNGNIGEQQPTFHDPFETTSGLISLAIANDFWNLWLRGLAGKRNQVASAWESLLRVCENSNPRFGLGVRAPSRRGESYAVARSNESIDDFERRS